MNHFDTMLAARAHRAGRALRCCLLRHRRLVANPLAVVVWQLGAESFAPGAIAWGSSVGRFWLAAPGEPRNRDLAFAATLRFARWFNARFESHGSVRETITKGTFTFTRAQSVPQVLVANRAAVGMVGRLGRRLAYLTAAGGTLPDPELVKLGKHLLFLSDHGAIPGQQLIVALTDLLNAQWATPMSPTERQSLAALDAYIAPPAGLHGFDAATEAERIPTGPVPGPEDDERLEPLVDEFNARRARSTDPTVVRPLLGPIENHYQQLTSPVWALLWRCRERELGQPEAPSVGRRWDEDRQAYTAHMDWMALGGRRRTRHTPRRAAMILRTLQDAQERMEAEEALDDPLRMIPYLLDNEAVRGRVVGVTRQHKEMAAKRRMKRPLVELLSPDPCRMPVGKELYWTEQPGGREFVVHTVQPAGTGARVILKLMTSWTTTRLPTVGSDACFSIHSTAERWRAKLPMTEPWTHRPAQPVGFGSIEDQDPEDR
jgi:hypothetical protein